MTLTHSGTRFLLFSAIAWRNIWRYPVRSILTVASLSGGVALVIFYASLVNGMTRQMIEQATEVSSGYIQIHSAKYIDDANLYALTQNSVLESLQDHFTGLTFSPRLYASALASSANLSSGVQIKAIDPNMEAAVTTMGQQYHSQPAYFPLRDSPAKHDVMVGHKLAKQLELNIGSELILVTQAADGSVGNDLYRVVGISRPVDPAFDRIGVLMQLDDYRELMSLPSGIHEIAVHINQLELHQAQQKLQQFLDINVDPKNEQDRPVARTWKTLNPAISDMLELQNTIVTFVAMVVMVMASFGVLNTILMSVFERKFEFGVLRALGIGKGGIIAMVCIEIVILTVISGVFGNLLGYWLSLRFQQRGIDFSAIMPDGYDWAGLSIEPFLKTEFQFSSIQQSNTVMLVVVILATLYPLLKIMSKKPVELLS